MLKVIVTLKGLGREVEAMTLGKILGSFVAKFSAELVPSMTLKGRGGDLSLTPLSMMFNVPNSIWSFSLN